MGQRVISFTPELQSDGSSKSFGLESMKSGYEGTSLQSKAVPPIASPAALARHEPPGTFLALVVRERSAASTSLCSITIGWVIQVAVSCSLNWLRCSWSDGFKALELDIVADYLNRRSSLKTAPHKDRKISTLRSRTRYQTHELESGITRSQGSQTLTSMR